MSNNKDLLLQILNNLAHQREPAQGLIVLVENGILDQQKIENILLIIKKSMKGVTDKKLKQQLEQSVKYIKTIKQKETAERKEEEADIEAMLDKF